ncbi:MAG: hypothetical protein ACE5G2_08410, partial [Candidatus Krumholzibacteriia bacterium]
MSVLETGMQRPAPQGLARAQLARQQRLAEARMHGELEARLHRRSSWLGVLRLLLFAVAAVFVVQAVRTAEDLLLRGFLPPILVFALVVVIHTRVQKSAERARRRRVLAEESAARLAGAMGPGASGELPARPASDLDAGRATLRDEGARH